MGASLVRLSSVTFLESFMCSISGSLGSITQHVTTGPASGPRPTSSMPAGYMPAFQNSLSRFVSSCSLSCSFMRAMTFSSSRCVYQYSLSGDSSVILAILPARNSSSTMRAARSVSITPPCNINPRERATASSSSCAAIPSSIFL